MGAINAYDGSEFPGAVTTIEVDLYSGDCGQYPTFEELVEYLQGQPGFHTTIRDRRAYTEATVQELAGLCEML